MFLAIFKIIKGKGYPCMMTKQFCSFLKRTKKNLKIFALVDYDPHGIEILMTYRSGTLLNNDYIDDIEYLGMTFQDLDQYQNIVFRFLNFKNILELSILIK